MLIVLGHSALVIAASFTSRMVKVTSAVLFVSIFHWWFDGTPWAGCFDAFWWIASFLLSGDLWLRLWWIIRNIGVWHLHWHWCVFLPLFSTSRCKTGETNCSSCVVFYGVWSFSVHWNHCPTWPSGLPFLRFLHKYDCLMFTSVWWFTSVFAFIRSFGVFNTPSACVVAVCAVEQAEWYWR